MMEQITFQYPLWYFIFCLALGVGMSWLLYRRDKQFREQRSWLIGLLAGLRFLTISATAAFLLSPLLKVLQVESREPVVVLAQDVSESVGAAMDEGFLSDYLASLERLSRALDRKYDLRTYSFGTQTREGLDTSFSDKITNLSQALEFIYDAYDGENLGAVILAGDGIYNEGSNPLYSGEQLAAPIYSVALGDTTPKRDLLLRRVFHNKIAYLGDRFSVQADIAAINSQGRATNLTVYKIENGQAKRLEQKNISIAGEDFFRTEEIVLEADAPGVQRYRLSLSAIDGEVSTVNNSRDIFVDVLDARQKILLLGLAPHPDIAGLRKSMEQNKNYEVEVAYLDALKVQPEEYDLVIFHQLPGGSRDIRPMLNRMNKSGTPRLFIAGTRTDYNVLNNSQQLVSIKTDGRNTTETQARLAPNFGLFSIEEGWDELSNYPPLLAPFGDFSVSPEAQVLLYQRIRKIDTQYPLLAMGEIEGVRTGLLLAEGIWKWRLFNFLQEEEHELADAFTGKMIQYLSVKEDKRKFRVSINDNLINESEQALFEAELYNNSYELINDPDVQIVIRGEEGRAYDFTFDKSGNAYRLNAGILPVGNYTFSARVVSGGEELNSSGAFSVQPIQLELYETTADHRLLRLLSDRLGGAVVYPEDLENLPDLLESGGTVKPVLYQTRATRNLINFKWIFFALLLLLVSEWFLRRYFGGY